MTARAFYCVADSAFFVGAVATINSLRLVGHGEPIYLLDSGLAARQRSFLEREATVLDADRSLPPHLLKSAAPLARPAGAMLLIDTDVVATRSLAPLFEHAEAGRIAAFADALPDRFDERWGLLLPPDARLRRQPYVNSGLVALPQSSGLPLLEAIRTAAGRIEPERSMIGEGTAADPFYFLDQDVLNALLSSLVPTDRLEILEHRLAPHPPFPGVVVRDERALRCGYADGTEPFVLHHIQRKPWLAPLRQNAYSRLLPRLLLREDLPLRLEPDEVPLRLREGALAALDRRRAASWAVWLRLRARVGVRRRLGRRLRGDEVQATESPRAPSG